MFFYLEGLATYLVSIWEGVAFVFLFGGAGHLFKFNLGGDGHLSIFNLGEDCFCFSIWGGWPLIHFFFGEGKGLPPILFLFGLYLATPSQEKNK